MTTTISHGVNPRVGLSDDERDRRDVVEANWTAVRSGAISSLVANIDYDRFSDWLLFGTGQFEVPADCDTPPTQPWLSNDTDGGVSSVNTEGPDGGAPETPLDAGVDAAAAEPTPLDVSGNGQSQVLRRRTWSLPLSDDTTASEQAWLNWLYQPENDTDGDTLLPVLSPSATHVSNACVADFNNDRDPDVFQVTWTDRGNAARAMLQLGDTTQTRSFSEVAVAAGIADEGRGRWVACLDYDLDGDVDVFVMNAERGKLYENQLHRYDPEDNTVELTEPDTNFYGIRVDPSEDLPLPAGAWITLQWLNTEGLLVSHSQEVHLNAGFGTQASREIHFGLGDVTELYRLIVQWPDGEVQTEFEYVPVNDIVRVRRTASE